MVGVTAFDESAPAPGVTATVAPATVAVVAALAAIPALAIAGAGTVLMAVGVREGRPQLHTVGGVCCFGGVILAAAVGVAPALALVGGAAAIVAWDVGDHAIGLGGQVGREAPARSNILTHLAVSAAAAASIVVVAGLVFALASRGNPSAAAGVLAVAVGAFALLLDR